MLRCPLIILYQARVNDNGTALLALKLGSYEIFKLYFINVSPSILFNLLLGRVPFEPISIINNY